MAGDIRAFITTDRGRFTVTMGERIGDSRGFPPSPSTVNVGLSGTVHLQIEEGRVVDSARLEETSQPYIDERFPNSIMTDYTCVLTGDFSDYRVGSYEYRYLSEVYSIGISNTIITGGYYPTLIGDDLELTVTHQDTMGSGPYDGDIGITLFRYDGAERDADGVITVRYTYETVQLNLGGQ